VSVADDGPRLDLDVFSERMQRLCSEGQAQAALDEVEAVLKMIEPSARLHAIHANVLRLSGHYGSAAAAWVAAAKLTPNDSAAWFGLAITLEQTGENGGAFQAYAKAIEVEPNHPAAFFKLIQRLMQAQHLGKVVERLDAATDAIKQSPQWYASRAQATFEMGDYLYAQKPPGRHAGIFSKNPDAMAGKLRAMVYDPSVDGSILLKAAQQWDRLHGPRTVESVPLQNLNPDRALRIGMVNTRMRNQNVGMQQLALLKNRPERSECSIHLYSSNDVDDDHTQTMIALADSHCDIRSMPDAEAVQRIRSDNIDILIDFNEYANNGRMGLFARRAAAIQVHYYGNALSTGLRAMDYRLSDPITEPEGGADTLSAETIVRMPKGYHFYEPPASMVDLVFDTPAKDKGYVTFGAIHHLAKYNNDVLAAYKRILEALPEARLVIARNILDDRPAHDALKDKLHNAGLPMDRVELRPDRGTIRNLQVWQDIDCVLDAFPFGSDATAMDSLFSGVPMVTLLGQRIASRRSGAMLHLLGCPELVAESEDNYCELAIELGRNIERLQSYRETLHAKFEASPLRQHAETASSIFNALRGIWQTEVKQQVE
jgi:protein O-GlcNAc transferase